MKLKKSVVAGLVLLSSVVAGLAGVVEVSTNITSETHWNAQNTYFVSENITVSTNLTIDPGTVIKVANGKIITVNAGMLQARGAADRKIVFTSVNNDSVGDMLSASSHTPAAGDWNMLYLHGGNVLEFCDISYADFGIQVECTYGGDAVSLRHNLITACTRGVRVSNTFGAGLDVSIFNNLIVDCVSGVQLELEGGGGRF